MSEELEKAIFVCDELCGTYDMDSSDFYDAFEIIMNFVKQSTRQDSEQLEQRIKEQQEQLTKNREAYYRIEQSKTDLKQIIANQEYQLEKQQKQIEALKQSQAEVLLKAVEHLEVESNNLMDDSEFLGFTEAIICLKNYASINNLTKGGDKL